MSPTRQFKAGGLLEKCRASHTDSGTGAIYQVLRYEDSNMGYLIAGGHIWSLARRWGLRIAFSKL